MKKQKKPRAPGKQKPRQHIGERRKNLAIGKIPDFTIGLAEAIGMIGLGLCALFPGLAEKVQEVLDEKDKQAEQCICVCHKPRFDSMPEECHCPVDKSGGLTDEHCKHFGRLFDTSGVQTFCHKCYCLKQCGAAV